MLIVHAKDHVVWVMDRGGPIGCNLGTVAVRDAMRKHNITGATTA